MNQLYLPISYIKSKGSLLVGNGRTFCFIEISLCALVPTKALCSSLISFIINGQDEQKKKKYRKINDKIAYLVVNYESENEMEF